MASLIKTPNVNISFDSALSFKLETLEFLKWFRIGTPLNSLLSQPLTTKRSQFASVLNRQENGRRIA